MHPDTQTVSPYLTLSHADAHPRRSILLSQHTTAVTSIVPSLLRGQHTTFLVSFTALMAEFLVVALSGLPIRSGQATDEFFFCGISSLLILAIMILVLITVTLWRRAVPHLPRKPDTTAGVMTYLADSRMVQDFEGVERMSKKERDTWVEQMGRRYEYGLKARPDGKMRWVIDHSQKGDEENMSLPSQHAWVMPHHPQHQRSQSRFE